MGVRPGLACPCPAGTAEQGQEPGKLEERWSPIRVRPYAEAGIPGEQESAPLRSAQRGGGVEQQRHTQGRAEEAPLRTEYRYWDPPQKAASGPQSWSGWVPGTRWSEGRSGRWPGPDLEDPSLEDRLHLGVLRDVARKRHGQTWVGGRGWKSGLERPGVGVAVAQAEWADMWTDSEGGRNWMPSAFFCCCC